MRSLVLAALLAFLPAPDFSGTYKGTVEGSEANMTLTQSGTSLSGNVKAMGITMNVTGTVSGSNATGDITILTEKLPFKASLNADVLKMEVGEYLEGGKTDFSVSDKLEFKREAGAAKPAEEKKQGPLSRKFKAEPSATLKNGKEYVHASGGRFFYPGDWTLKEQEEGYIELFPPAAGDVRVFVSAEPANGKTEPNDPEVASYLDQLVGTAVPGARRVGTLEPAAAGNGKGVAYTWEGGGKRIRAYVTILKGQGVSLVAVGSKADVEKLEPKLKEMFVTFGWGQGKIDNRMVGTWQFFSYSQVSGRSTKATAQLGADGSFSYASDSESNNNYKGKDGLGNETWTGWVGSRSGSGYKGTWAADGKTLYLNFEDGSTETFDYTFEQQGTAFVLKLFGSNPKKPMEWSKVSGG